MEPHSLHISEKNAMRATVIISYFYHWIQKCNYSDENSAHQRHSECRFLTTFTSAYNFSEHRRAERRCFLTPLLDGDGSR